MINKPKKDFYKKIFWSHIRSKLKTKTRLTPILQDEMDKTSSKVDDKKR